MTYIFLVCLLTGAVFGMRLKVFVLIPAIGSAALVNAALGLMLSLSISSIIISFIISILGLQFGYLAGSVSRFFIGAARIASRRRAMQLSKNHPANA